MLIKREDLQPVFSFKIRGAYNKMALLIKNVISCIANFNIEGHMAFFEMLKEKTIVDYRNRRFQQAYKIGRAHV